jgi:hypothetical protein
MSIQPETVSEPYPSGEVRPSSTNPAVALCCEAWDRIYRETLAGGRSRGVAKFNAREAYSNALPPLAGPDNIRAFIACVAHGMLIGAIEEKRGARLLYAAQVAHTALRSQSVRQKTW